MLANTATASATSAIQRSSPRESNSMLIAEISSNAWRTPTESAAPGAPPRPRRRGRTRSGCGHPPGQHHIGVRTVQFSARASASLLAATTALFDHRPRDQPLDVGQRAGQAPPAGPQLSDGHRSRSILSVIATQDHDRLRACKWWMLDRRDQAGQLDQALHRQPVPHRCRRPVGPARPAVSPDQPDRPRRPAPAPPRDGPSRRCTAVAGQTADGTDG